MSLKNMDSNNVPGTVSNAFWIFSNIFVIVIGSGLWVANKKGVSFWKLVRQALHLEKKEATYLLNYMMGISNADIIIRILVGISVIDDVLDEKEKRFIEVFANTWKIDIDWEKTISQIREGDFNNRYIQVRTDVIDYLSTGPHPEQVAQLIDLINILVRVDEDFSENEQLIVEELSGICNNYLKKDDNQPVFYTVIVPQNQEQEVSIININPEIKKKEQIFGGSAYMDGPFYSEKYANIICDKYRVVNLFSVAVPHRDKTEGQDGIITGK